ncbi:hypothetical protein L484_027035 [Morus notabilis]|uniref:Uncharacterized protein n=1 Tax=Morus notabilis TaxID=981085 RepID=W9R1I2_9ROSA|nr:hypothetical protein L484_027035 [Morus notabilis]
MAPHFLISLSLLVVVTLAVTIIGIHAINVYDFDIREIRVAYAKQTLISATYNLRRLFGH